MNKNSIANSRQDIEQHERNYFSTPNTTVGKQKQVSKYDDSFDPYVKSYKISGTKPVIKKYVIR